MRYIVSATNPRVRQYRKRQGGGRRAPQHIRASASVDIFVHASIPGSAASVERRTGISPALLRRCRAQRGIRICINSGRRCCTKSCCGRFIVSPAGGAADAVTRRLLRGLLRLQIRGGPDRKRTRHLNWPSAAATAHTVAASIVSARELQVYSSRCSSAH